MGGTKVLSVMLSSCKFHKTNSVSDSVLTTPLRENLVSSKVIIYCRFSSDIIIFQN